MSWQTFVGILAEARQIDAQEETAPPESCPNDGTPLQGVDGVLHCPFDGYQYPRDGYHP